MLSRCLLLSGFSVLLGGAAVAADPADFAAAITDVRVCATDAALPLDFDTSDCERRELGSVDPQTRPLWLLASTDIPPAFIASAVPLMLHIGALATSEVYWNGEYIGSNGSFGLTAATESPGKLDATLFVPPRLIVAGKNQLAIRMASFHNPVRVFAPVHYVYVTAATPNRPSMEAYYAPSLLTAGAFALAAVYFGFIWLSDRRSGGSGCIALLALFAGVQLLAETSRAYIAYDYPWQVWRLILITLCAVGFALAMSVYIAGRFRPDKGRTASATILLIAALSAAFAPGFDLKALLPLLAGGIVSLLVVGRPALKGVKGARLAALALLGFVSLILVDRLGFLDRSFYFAAALLMLVLLVDRARELQRIRVLKNEMRGRAERLELELLRRSIAPHFLMNTLNALTEWVESDPATGIRMIDAVADEFRLLSQMSDRALVPLREELALCQRHLEVMSFRVDRAFALRTDDVNPQLRVPPGVIHTLVENAFTHGRFADGAEFVLRESRADGRTTLTLTAPASESPRSGSNGNAGAGLTYVKRRLEVAFGNSASFSDGPGPDGGWVSTLAFEAGGA